MKYRLPPIARRLEAILGRAALRKLASARGGTLLYVPLRGRSVWLQRLVGADGAQRLACELGGTTIVVPRLNVLLRADRDTEIVARYRSGESACALARDYALNYRTIQRIVASGGPSAGETSAAEPHAGPQLELALGDTRRTNP